MKKPPSGGFFISGGEGKGSSPLVRSKQSKGLFWTRAARAEGSKIRSSGFFAIPPGAFDGLSPATF
jgi:hypothetical protein